MSTPTLSNLIARIKTHRRIDANDILALRKEIFADNIMSVTEADALFALNQLPHKPDGWSDMFIHAITSFLVRQTMPHGYVNQANAAWLMARIDHDGVVESHTELELLLNVMKRADNITNELEMYALAQVKQAVLNGTGYLGQGHRLQPGTIGEAETEILRRVLYACSSEGGIGISKSEAEVLFDLNDATAHLDNHESWTRLFVGGIANHLMMLAAWEEPNAAEVLRRENWLTQPSPGFLGQCFSNIGSIFKAFTAEPDIQFTHMHKANVANAERITTNEANWLIIRLNRDGVLSKNEAALLQFLKQESPAMHESLFSYLQAV